MITIPLSIIIRYSRNIYKLPLTLSYEKASFHEVKRCLFVGKSKLRYVIIQSRGRQQVSGAMLSIINEDLALGGHGFRGLIILT